MKKYTVEEVAAYLIGENPLEWDFGKAWYHLYYTDGELGGNVRNAEFCAQARATYLEDMREAFLAEARKVYCGDDEEQQDIDDGVQQDIDDMVADKLYGPNGIWATESLANPGFAEVVRELTDELNAYIAESAPSRELSEAAREMAAHVTFGSVLYAACTACASVEPETRQNGVYVHCLGDEFGDGDCVFFNGAELPANEEEARALLEESADSTQECLDSIEFVR